MSEPIIEDVKIELDLREINSRVRIDLQIIQKSLERIETYLNALAQRIYNLENP